MTNQPTTGAAAPSDSRANDAAQDAETPTEAMRAQSASQSDAARVTRPLPAVSLDEDTTATATAPAADGDDGATVVRESVRSTPASRPRKTTLAVAITRPTRSDERTASGNGDGPRPGVPPTAPAPAASVMHLSQPDVSDPGVPDEVYDEVDEWAMADQPTLYLPPRPPSKPRPEYLETGEGQSWPPRPTGATPPRGVPRGQTPRPTMPRPPSIPTTPRRDLPRPPLHPTPPQSGRLASPSGRMMPGTPPAGMPRGAMPNPRMERFQELRRQRSHHLDGERDPDDPRPVTEMVRQWWNDLMPGLQGALHYQREARASGVHPIPAYVPQPGTRLGDAFGRLTQTARDLTGRAQAAAGPTLKRWHTQAEQAAQALVERIEGSPAQQQQPLLGPGRLAVFFRSGVTVGQAQKLLAASQARPMRLIPRKHGFLAYVTPGLEAEIGERLRVHPYVRDVAYLEYPDSVEPQAPAQ